MAAPLLLLPLDGSLAYQDGGAGGTAVGVGALRWVEGETWGSTVALVEEGTINHHHDPYAVNPLWAWTPIADGTISRDTGNLPPVEGLPVGAASVKHTKTGASPISAGQHWDRRVEGVLGGTPCSVSCWVYHNRPGVESIEIQAEVAGAAWVSETHAVAPNTWTFVTMSGTLGTGATAFAGRVRTAAWSAGSSLWLFGLQVEQQPFPTTTTPAYDNAGTIRPGYAWTGTAHDSDSTRAATGIRLVGSGLDANEFAVAFRARVTAEGPILQIGDSNGVEIRQYAGKPNAIVYNGYGWMHRAEGAAPLTPGWHTWYVRRSVADDVLLIAIDGTTVVTTTAGAPRTTTDLLSIGQLDWGGGQGQLEIGPVFAFAAPLLREHIHALTVTPAWTWDQFAPPPVYVPPVVPSLPSLATPQDALNERLTDVRLTVYIGEVETPVEGITAQFDVDQEIGVGRLDLLLPQPPQVDYLAPILVQGGHNDLIGTIASGFIPEWQGAVTNRGNVLTVQMVGWAALLAEAEQWDLVFEGPISLRSLFVALCERKGVPAYLADHCTYPDGVTEIMLGGNSQVDGGQVIIRAGSSPLAFLNRQAEPYGYRVYDTPQGVVVLRRISGRPVGAPLLTFSEGIHPSSLRRTFSARDLVNYWDVHGQTYDDEYGGRIPIRSIPAAITPHRAIPGTGIRYRKVSNSDAVRQDQADAIRNVLEIDHSEPATPITWNAVAVPFVAPGDVVEVISPLLTSAQTYWLMGLDLSNSDEGFVATYTGWAGAGQPLPAANDRITIPIQTAPLHLGDETVPWYAHPAPQGPEKVWTITIPERVSVANIRGWHHSTNSQLVGGEDTDLQVTSWEIWEHGVDRTNKDNRPLSQGKMARLPERYGERPPFWDGLKEWAPFAISLRSLDAGQYDLVLRAGKDKGLDDFEVQQVLLELFGTVEPAVIVIPEAA